MNIYCVIFMCTFGTNNTDTEVPSKNSLIETGSPLHNLDNRKALDVAKRILPEKGEAVPQTPDIVMDLPTLHLHHSKDNAPQPFLTSRTTRPPKNSPLPSSTLTLSDILLPPSARQRNQVD